MNAGERPILFSTEMVKAILEGKKTQTRRVVNPQPVINGSKAKWRDSFSYDIETLKELLIKNKSPYGKPGDLLYVRETWMPAGWSESGDDWCIHFKANGPSGINIPFLFDDEQKQEDFWIKISEELEEAGCPQVDGMFQDVTAYLNWRPSIFMPKNAARIWLKVNDVRVERVQDIPEKDAVAEGINMESEHASLCINIENAGYSNDLPKGSAAIAVFKHLWDSINAKRGFGWDKNPWVWVVDFEVISTNGKKGA